MSTILTTTPRRTGDCAGCEPGDLVSLERTRFFPRQLVTPDDLTQDQVYFREKLRRHNRLMHGWGIVCGALVQHREGCELTVTPGYVLGPWGDEILLDEEVSIDVCKSETAGPLDCFDADPWCGTAPRLKEDTTAYLAVRHVERATRPIRAPGCDCGCDDDGCEYSRTLDSFELAVLTELPAAYRTAETPDPKSAIACVPGARAACPPCPDDPWVVLCDFKVAGGAVTEVDCDRHRRYVASYGAYWFACGGAAPPPPPAKTICHSVFGFEWEGISAMPPELDKVLRSGNLKRAVALGLKSLGTVEFEAGKSGSPQSKLVAPLPFKTDSLYQVYVYPVDATTTEPMTAQAAAIADLVVTNRYGLNPVKVNPKSVPDGVDCPLVTVVVLGFWESG
jgi:hypothetical protein